MFKKFLSPFLFVNRSVGHHSIEYSEWISKIEPNSSSKTGYIVDPIQPLALSIILVDSFCSDRNLLDFSISSVVNQSVPNWELLLVTNNLEHDDSILLDQRITMFSSDSLDFFDSVNSVIKHAHGGYVTFLRSGDRLSMLAVLSLQNQVLTNKKRCKLVVADEDELDASSLRCNPFFKPDWNVDYLVSFNYFARGVFYDKTLFIESGGFNNGMEDPYHSLALQTTSILTDGQIDHIPHILFHFKQGIDEYKSANTVRIYNNRLPDIPQPTPLVSIIIPTKDQLPLLRNCLDGVLNNTNYENIEIIVIDNNSEYPATQAYLNMLVNDHGVRVLSYDMPFNYSDMNNLAVQEANGELLCFLNNDISMLQDDWLLEMVVHVNRPDIGCVGAKLFYPDGTIQHAGVILGLKGYASHAHKGFDGKSTGYFNRLSVTHNVSAVTAACMVVRKEVFEEVGGFDAVNLKVAYNDVDLCLKVMDAGYRNLFTPHAKLIHHESKSRGKKRKPKQQKQLREESEYFRDKWKGLLDCDPAYNKNLTLLREDFSLSKDRR